MKLTYVWPIEQCSHNSQFHLSMRSSSYAAFYLNKLLGPQGTMYSVIILCKACIFYSLLVQFMKMQKTKPNMFLRETIKLGRDISWKLLVKAQNISTICEYLQKYLDVLPSMVTDILKQNVMCTVSFVQFASFSSKIWVFCLKSKILKA